jgi:hypothetical protein
MTPTLTVKLYKKVGSDSFGQPTLDAGRDQRCAPVKLLFTDQHTSVRTDASGTHGHGYETNANVILLVPFYAPVGSSDVIEVLGHRVQVVALHQRYAASGRPDHVEVHCAQWV